MEFRERLDKVIKSKKLSQAKLAEILGVSTGNVSMWLNPKYNTKPTLDVLVQFSERLNINLNWLLTGQGSMFSGENHDRKLEELEAEINQLRLQVADLKAQNKEMDDEIKQRLRQLLGLQEQLLESKA